MSDIQTKWTRVRGSWEARVGGVTYSVRKRSPGGMVKGLGWEVCTGWPRTRVHTSYYLADAKAWVEAQANDGGLTPIRID